MKSFDEISQINVNEHAESKNGLTYLTWSWAWSVFVRAFPNAHYTIWRDPETHLPYVADDTGYMVFTSITVSDVTHEMWLPVMNHRNKALKAGEADMFDVNKTLMRCLVKNMAMFGLGLYIYAGEDLPEEPVKAPETPAKAAKPPKAAQSTPEPEKKVEKAEKPVSVPDPKLMTVKLTEDQRNAIIDAFEQEGIEVWDLEKICGDQRTWTVNERRELLKKYSALTSKKNPFNREKFLAGEDCS